MAMQEGCLAKTVQISLFLTNFLVFILGCVVLGFGSYVLITGSDIVSLIDTTDADSIKIYSSAAILLIVIAVAVVIVTFFGCCGAWKVSRCMLGTYFTAILVLFICILVGAVIAVTQDLDFVPDALKKTMDSYGQSGPDNDVITEAWDSVQKDYECCGVEYFTDWATTEAKYKDKSGNENSTFTMPSSCCESATDYWQCVTRTNTTADDIEGFTKGCWTKFNEDIIDGNKNEILYTGIVIIVIMFLNMLFSFAMCTMAGGD